jgi:ParB family chromosome partitioning protein
MSAVVFGHGLIRNSLQNLPIDPTWSKRRFSAMSQKIIQQIPLDKIITGKQVRERFDEESLKGLAQSIRENGQHEPIHVVPLAGDMYSVITGGRRMRALRKNGSINVDAVVEKSELSKSEMLTRQITENTQREDLTAWEKAKAIELLMKETGWNATQTAAKLGFADSTITKLLSLLSLPAEIQERLRAGELPATAAYELTKVHDATEQDQLACQVANGELTRDGLSRAIKAQKRNHRARKNSARRSSTATARLENRQSVTVSAPALDLNSFVEILETLLGQAHLARTEGLTLEALLKRLKTSRLSATPAMEAG